MQMRPERRITVRTGERSLDADEAVAGRARDWGAGDRVLIIDEVVNYPATPETKAFVERLLRRLHPAAPDL